jgi:hypothetical protein
MLILVNTVRVQNPSKVNLKYLEAAAHAAFVLVAALRLLRNKTVCPHRTASATSRKSTDSESGLPLGSQTRGRVMLFFRF